MTIAEYSHQFLAGLELMARPNTVSAYRSDLTLAAHHLTRPLDQISLNDVVVFLSVGDVAAATIARRAASLKQFFAWAVQQGQRLEIVQRVLGHCDIRSTQGYADLDDIQVREALARRTRNG